MYLRENRGYTMIEIILVISIGLAMIIAGMIFTSRMVTQQEVAEVADDLRAYADAIESTYALSEDFSGVSPDSAASVAPERLLREGGLVRHKLGGTVSFHTIPFGGPPIKPRFELRVDGLSRRECSQLASDLSPHFQTVSVGGLDVRGDPAAASAACHDNQVIVIQRERGARAEPCNEKTRQIAEACPSGDTGKVFFVERYSCPTGYEPGIWGAREETGRTCVGATPPAPDDACSNLEGNQASIPVGWRMESGKCCPPSYPIYRFPFGSYNIAVPSCATNAYILAQGGGGGGASTSSCTGYYRGAYGAPYDSSVWRGPGCCGLAGGGGGGGAGRQVVRPVSEGDWLKISVGNGGEIDVDGGPTEVSGRSAPLYQGPQTWSEVFAGGKRGTINVGGKEGGDYATKGEDGAYQEGQCPPPAYQTRDCIGGYSPVVFDPSTGTSSGGECLGWSQPYWVYPPPPTHAGGLGGIGSVNSAIVHSQRNLLPEEIKTGWPSVDTFSNVGNGGIGGGLGPNHNVAQPGKSGYVLVSFETDWPEVAQACGPAHGETYAFPPDNHLRCTSGWTPSTITGNGPWSWNCSRSGVYYSCQAHKSSKIILDSVKTLMVRNSHIIGDTYTRADHCIITSVYDDTEQTICRVYKDPNTGIWKADLFDEGKKSIAFCDVQCTQAVPESNPAPSVSYCYNNGRKGIWYNGVCRSGSHFNTRVWPFIIDINVTNNPPVQ